MLTHKGTQTIHTDRLVLRRLTIDDAAAMFRNWAGDDEVTRYLTWPAHQSEDISRMILDLWVRDYARSDFYQWGITIDGELVGTISVVNQNNDVEKMEIGYCIGRNWWHKGITSEALAAVINYLFDEVGARRIESRHDPRNPNSGAVMRKCGMKYEGTLRRSDRNNQGICDACHYAILADER